MSARNSYTTADYLEWDSMIVLVKKLFKDKEYRFSLLIGCGCLFGLRISDLRTLTWNMILNQDSFMINEKKTGKRRIIKINNDFQKHIKDCFEALHITDLNEPCFLSQKGQVYSIQRINSRFKEIKVKYHVKIKNFSTHSMRKTLGRKVVESAGKDAEMALIKLSEMYNHSSPQVTRRYLGLRQQEIAGVYDALDF